VLLSVHHFTVFPQQNVASKKLPLNGYGLVIYGLKRRTWELRLKSMVVSSMIGCHTIGQ